MGKVALVSPCVDRELRRLQLRTGRSCGTSAVLTILCVIESGTWVESHIVESLRSMGHCVRVFYYGPSVGEFYGAARREERAEKNRALVQLAETLCQGPGLDLIFCYVYDDFLQEYTADALARLGVPMVNYNVDMVNQWYRQTLTAQYFSRMLCAQRANMDQLARYNPRALYFPMAGRTVVTDGGDREFIPAAPVTFLGTPMPHRVSVLARIHAQGLPLAIYGKYWQEGLQASAPASFEKVVHDIRHYTAPKLRAEGISGLREALGRRLTPVRSSIDVELPRSLCKGIVPDESLRSFFQHSAINLGFNRIAGDDPDKPGVTQLRLRDFEVPLAGGFLLVERTVDHEELFVRGLEVETWETPDELAGKIHYYLAHDDERRKIAEAGKRRAESEHTWEKRFEMLFGDLGLTGH